MELVKVRRQQLVLAGRVVATQLRVPTHNDTGRRTVVRAGQRCESRTVRCPTTLLIRGFGVESPDAHHTPSLAWRFNALKIVDAVRRDHPVHLA
jgi:hypothetical protein